MPPERRGGLGAAYAKAAREARNSLLRNHGGGRAPVSNLELFFDLVFVFAVTQLSHFLLGRLTLVGLVEAGVMFLALWWAWMFTTWATNWADPQRVPVRIMLILVMLASLVMAIALPHAFERDGMRFALSYLAIQIGRTLFMAAIMRGPDRTNAWSMVRISIWFGISAVAWVGGALSELPSMRLAWWIAALAFEYSGPLLGFALPRLGHSRPADWNISGSHMAERCALFIIIALGEGIVVTGSGFAAEPPSIERVVALGIAFATSVTMWWIYFDIGAERGAQLIEHHADAELIARNAYTYQHMPIVAGIVVSAVADALLLQEPLERASHRLVTTLCGGALAFLIGAGLFKRHSSERGNFPFSHTLGAGGMVILAVFGWFVSPQSLVYGALAAAVLAFVALWEWGSFHGGWQVWAPRLGQKLGWKRAEG